MDRKHDWWWLTLLAIVGVASLAMMTAGLWLEPFYGMPR